MSEPLLLTKLFVSPPRPKIILRLRRLRFSPSEAAEFHLWLTRLILHGIVGQIDQEGCILLAFFIMLPAGIKILSSHRIIPFQLLSAWLPPRMGFRLYWRPGFMHAARPWDDWLQGHAFRFR
jgi:hypothetical protein